MNRYFIEIAYNGSTFHGWQIQENAHSVQACINKALGVLTQNPQIETLGCGRTDTGVHANTFYLHTNIEQQYVTPKFLHSLNGLIPYSIVAKNIYLVHSEANARFDAISRTYLYFFHENKNPFLNKFSMQLRTFPNIDNMNLACELLYNYSDFSCFSKSNTQTLTNNCTIQNAQFYFQKNQLVFEIKANRFLRNMVRAIVGTMLNIGYGKDNLENFKKIIESKNRSNAGVSVPAHGLYLNHIEYPLNFMQKIEQA
jgi:tRNA pseudouridine38-40 synthase